MQWFNNTLKVALQKLVIENKPLNYTILQQQFRVKVSHVKKILLFIPACVGYIIHVPIYIPIQRFAYAKFGKIDHYDSVQVSLLFLLYPIYVAVLAAVVATYIGGLWWLAVLLLMPFCAWSYVQLKKQF